jgi:hypothetical protein
MGIEARGWTLLVHACNNFKSFQNSRIFTERQRLQNHQNPLLQVLVVLEALPARPGILSHPRVVGVVQPPAWDLPPGAGDGEIRIASY